MTKQVICTECGETVDSSKTRRGMCNRCYMRAWYTAHHDQQVGRSKRWRAENYERAKEIQRGVDHRRRARMTKEQKVAESRRRTEKMSQAEREKRKEYQKRYYQEHKPERYRLARESKKRHPETRVACEQRRRARKRGANPDLTQEQWRQIVETYDHRCAYCGKKFKRLTMDHVIPFAKGGRHTMSNVVPACRPCNVRKNASPPPIPVQPVML